MQKVKKIPQRQCVGCRTKRDKRDLLRIVKTRRGRSCWMPQARDPDGACTSVPTRSACGRPASPWAGACAGDDHPSGGIRWLEARMGE